MEKNNIAPEIYQLYDKYCHGSMKRREFLKRAGMLTFGGISGLVMAKALLPNYAKAQLISFTDERIKAKYVEYDSPGGNSGKMRGYLVQPKGKGPFPAVLIVHENRGLNPHIEDVARRAATEGFLAFAPDALYPLGGYPGNDDDGKVMQKKLDRDKIFIDMKNGAKFLKAHSLSNGKLGVTGFCFGGAVSNYLAAELGSELKIAVPFYGTAIKSEEVKKIKSSLIVQYAEDDPRVNATMDEYKKALTAIGVDFKMHIYPGTKHGFHNNSTPRYDEKAAKLAWQRTISAFKKHLLID
ncbi:MAG: dienelactone hydrolase [Halobacteriovorax sp.]|nr:dienelactone hydrolase [Halobacteriovorax sp.]|tara:strand:+ start:16818 stop:17705 length:888 start_codon:yes stop_codon:yes gene_type:complete